MSWLMYATRSTRRTIFPSRVAGSFGPVWLRIPSRVSAVRLRPRPSRSRVSAEARGERLVEGLLARVPEGCVAEVVAERDRLREILVQPQRARHGPGDSRRLEGVREPRAVVVATRVDEDLGLVPESAERLVVDDAVAIALERRPQAALLLFLQRAPAGRVGAHGERGEPALLVLADASLELVRDPSRHFGHETYGIARR